MIRWCRVESVCLPARKRRGVFRHCPGLVPVENVLKQEMYTLTALDDRL
jgi:hypothetical protein